MDNRAGPRGSALPAVPHIVLGPDGVLELAARAPDRFRAVLAAGRSHYGGAAMVLGNALSRRWLTRNANPYLTEIDGLAGLAGTAGVHLLNMSYEWTCTSSAGPDPQGTGARLLRRVFDTCETYADAKAVLAETPLAMPAFFTLVGLRPDEGCVIERAEDRAFVRAAPASVANHWIDAPIAGRYRGVDSEGRYAQMEGLRDRAGLEAAFDWVVPPVLNPTTRLAVVANPATGRLDVQGWEADGPATAVFSLA